MLYQCLFLCLCFVVSSYSHASAPSFIDKCVWSDEACLIASTNKALPHFAEGLPEYGVEPMDPLKMEKVTLEEGDLKVLLTKMIVTGASKCNILKVTRDIKKQTLRLVAELPIDVVGDYEASGKLLFQPIEGKGPFHVNCKLIHVEVLVDVKTVVGPDGVARWKVGKPIITYEAKEKCTFDFKNLFNGDKAKAQPVLDIMDVGWKEIMESIGKPIMHQGIGKMVKSVDTFCSHMPADQLEIL